MAGIQIDGVNNKIDFDDDQDTSISANTDDTLVIEVGTNTLATFTSTSLTINDGTTIITNDNSDTLTLQSADADGSEGPVMVFDRASASPADDDVLGAINFRGKDSGGNGVDYVKIQAEIMQESDGSEDGQLQFNVQKAGTSRNILTLDRTVVVINEDSQDIDFRVESADRTSMLNVDAGLNKVGIGDVPDLGFAHVKVADSGASVDANYDTLVLEESGHSGIQILSGTSSTGLISFNDSGGTNRGYFGYAHSADRMEFATAGTERMRITSDGHVYINTTSTEETNAKFCAATTGVVAEIRNDNASYGSSNSVQSIACKRSSNSVYRLLRGVSGNGSSTAFSDNEFIFTGAGGLAIDGSYTSGGADYAEMFEWKDGNASSEDRRGYSVVLDGNQIVKATESDDASKIIGIVSALPVLVGDSDIDEKWKSKYLTDDFGNYVMEEHTVTEWTDEDGKDHSYDTDKIPDGVTAPSDATVISTEKDGAGNTINLQRKKLNPDWDSSKTYIRRKDRKEWDAIGLMGKLRILKGQPTGTNWIKMRDISDSVEEWLVR